MKESPDLSRIISVIMENPEIVNQISSLLSGQDEKEEPTSANPVQAVSEEPNETPVVANPIEKISKSAKRKQLLTAMKPYLSEDRARAVDSMLSIADVLSMMRGD